MIITTQLDGDDENVLTEIQGKESSTSTIIGAERFRKGMSLRLVRWDPVSRKINLPKKKKKKEESHEREIKLPAFLYMDYIFFSSSIELRFPNLAIHKMSPVRFCFEL